MKKVWNVISSILIAVILIVAVVMTAMVIVSTRNEDGIPSLFGYALFNVKTDSMEGPDGFPAGSLIVIKKVTPAEAESLKPGDVVTFRREFEGQTYLDTHRIAEITPEMIDQFGGSSMISAFKHEIVDGVWVHGGEHYYVTKGDHEVSIDYQADGTFQYAHKGNIVGTWTGFQIPVLGKIIEFMQSQLGFMVCIVIPVALFFIYELYVFIVTLTRKKKEEALAEVTDKEEELKRKAVEEFLAQQAASSGASAEAKAEEAADAKSGTPAEAKKEEKEESKEEKAQETQSKEEAPAEEPKEEKKSKKDKKKSKKDKEDKAEDSKKDEPKEEKTEEKSADKKEDEKTENSAKSADDISEEEKQRIIQEYLAKQAADAAGKKD